MNYSITQYGKELEKSLYTIDEENKTFTSKENNLVLDFSDLNYWDFKTGSGCIFKTGWECTFKTGSGCVFKTGWNCIFKNGTNCVLLGYDFQKVRYFLDNSNYTFISNQLIEIKDKNQAILNMKHENKYVRNLCKDILKGN